MAEIEQTFRDLIVSQLIGSAYMSFAAELNEIPTENQTLRTYAEVAELTADDAVPTVQNADIDVCKYLKQWQTGGWGERFGVKLRDAPFTIFGVDRDLRARTVRSQESVTREHPTLGLRQAEWLDLALAVVYPIW